MVKLKILAVAVIEFEGCAPLATMASSVSAIFFGSDADSARKIQFIPRAPLPFRDNSARLARKLLVLPVGRKVWTSKVLVAGPLGAGRDSRFPVDLGREAPTVVFLGHPAGDSMRGIPFGIASRSQNLWCSGVGALPT